MTSLYADDALIYCTAPTIPSLKTKLQKYVDDVCVWYNGNKFGINVTKSNTMVIASNNFLHNCSANNLRIMLNGCEIENCDHTDYLGLTIDHNHKTS